MLSDKGPLASQRPPWAPTSLRIARRGEPGKEQASTDRKAAALRAGGGDRPPAMELSSFAAR